MQELEKRHGSVLPHHDSGDVSERAEGTAGISRDNDIDAPRSDESSVALTHREHHGARDQCRCEIVKKRRERENENAGYPVNRPKAEASRHQPRAQRCEVAPLLHGVGRCSLRHCCPTPDQFLTHTLNLAPGVMLSALQRLSISLKNPAVAVEDYLVRLEQHELPTFVAKLQLFQTLL